jgi:hypothetical protein
MRAYIPSRPGRVAAPGRSARRPAYNANGDVTLLLVRTVVGDARSEAAGATAEQAGGVVAETRSANGAKTYLGGLALDSESERFGGGAMFIGCGLGAG